jgi:DNA repair protein RadC
MATALSSAKSQASRRRREDAAIARGAAALLRRLRREGRIENPRSAEAFLRMRLAGLPHEELHALWLDGQRRIIGCDVLARGAVDRAEVDVRGLVRTALERNAAAVILAHNHPSGVAQPSREDVAFTARLRAGLAFVEVVLLAHFVVGEGEAVRVQ